MSERLHYVTDKQRHLVCLPYNIDNLHRMAVELGIRRHWFHRDHYDIPVHMKEDIERRCVFVRPRDIISIIKGRYVDEQEYVAGRWWSERTS